MLLVALGWTPAETFASGICKTTGKLQATLGLTLLAWQHGVDRMLAEIWGAVVGALYLYLDFNAQPVQTSARRR